MQKSFLFSVLTITVLFSAIVGAECQDRYVRKQLKPNFFIPDKELNRAERLPEFIMNSEKCMDLHIIIIKPYL